MAETDNYQRQRRELDQKIFQTEAHQKWLLARFGDHVAEREEYRSSDLHGIHALRYYLMQKHHWTPATVLALSEDEIRFALLEEREGWTLPPEDQP
ncbi:hypothetical protein NPJ88_003640 [Halomonas elongata]|uniref:hypothetical protein n=1 Tax=Halomonas elongata TaxID=2746 RepID=UPI00255AC9B6|nr:hypothetical protein [Halomonas elongata]MDL4861418.1 hypothetical protein [Halomonas elongata]